MSARAATVAAPVAAPPAVAPAAGSAATAAKAVLAAPPARVAAAGTQAAPAPASGAPALEVSHLACGYGGAPVLDDVSFSLARGRALVLLGPNGVGKTTLFKTILGFMPRLAGDVLIEGEEVRGWSRRRYARSVAYVPQAHESAFGFTVREMVLMGRTPSLDGFAGPSREDERIAGDAIDELGLSALAERDCTTLSGGERQMVLVARALAQQPRLLVMDEPCANLDLGNQVIVLRRILALVERGLAVVITSHDPNHAFLLGSDVVCVGRGFGVRAGAARDVLTAEALGALYGIEVGVGEVEGPQGKTGTACTPFLESERIVL